MKHDQSLTDGFNGEDKQARRMKKEKVNLLLFCCANNPVVSFGVLGVFAAVVYAVDTVIKPWVTKTALPAIMKLSSVKVCTILGVGILGWHIGAAVLGVAVAAAIYKYCNKKTTPKTSTKEKPKLVTAEGVDGAVYAPLV
jgi:hypothetical protein